MKFSRLLVAAALILAACFLVSACGNYWKETHPTISPPSRPEPCAGENCDDVKQSCFLAGTLIKYSDGTSKPIEQVQVGDEVLSYDIMNNKYVNAKVLELESPIREGYCIISFSDGTKLKLTDEHPVYTKKGWASVNPEATQKDADMNVAELERGDQVFKDSNSWLSVTKIEYIKKTVKTYNLKQVSEHNTFFAGDILVHNKGGSGTGGGGGGGGTGT